MFINQFPQALVMIKEVAKKHVILLVALLILFSVFVIAEDGSEDAPCKSDADCTAGLICNGTACVTGAVKEAADTSVSDAAEASVKSTEKGDLDSSYEWLWKAATEESNGGVDIQAFVILALAGKSYDITNLTNDLFEQEDKENYCWPEGWCETKKSALATLAWARVSDGDISNETAWIKNSLIPGVKEGEWWLVIDSSSSDGSCDISYTLGEGDSAKDESAEFELKGDKVKRVGAIGGEKYYIDISRDVKAALINREVSKTISVNCGGIEGEIHMSLLYKDGSNYYILDSASGTSKDFVIDNGCFPAKDGGTSCDYESTVYATWVLTELGSYGINEVGTKTYLLSQLSKGKNNKDVHKAVLARALLNSNSQNNYFLNLLAKSQKSDGSWGGNVYDTAFSVFSLSLSGAYNSNVERGISFLERKKQSDGSWGRKMLDTSMALIALGGSSFKRGGGFVPPKRPVPSPAAPGNVSSLDHEICDDGRDNDMDGLTDCADSDCHDSASDLELCHCHNEVMDIGYGEEGADCGPGCARECDDGGGGKLTECTSDIDCPLGEVCGSGGYCKVEGSDGGGGGGTGGVTVGKCNSDKDCASGEKCDKKTSKCEKKGSSAWIWILLIILVLGGGGFALYFFGVKGGGLGFGKKSRPARPSFADFKGSIAQRPAGPMMARPAVRPAVRAASSSGLQKHEEDALEKSLKEAERLLKKK